MLAYRINLLRQRPVPWSRRPAMARLLLVYFLAAGALLAWECNRATHQVLEARLRDQALRAQHASFLRRHPGTVNVESYALELRSRLRRNAETLAAIQRVMGNQRPAAGLIYGVMAPLPADVRLLTLDLNVAEGTLRFDLALPLDAAGTPSGSAAMLAAWQRDPVLRRWVSNLREVSSVESRLPEGGQVSLVRFEGSLSGNGG
jgi:hypothetical protein